MKFRVDLPMKHPYLHVQLLDRDLMTANDCIAETVLDLSKAMRIAYATKTSYMLYRDAKAARQDLHARAKTQRKEAKQSRKERRAAALARKRKAKLFAPPEGAAMRRRYQRYAERSDVYTPLLAGHEERKGDLEAGKHDDSEPESDDLRDSDTQSSVRREPPALCHAPVCHRLCHAHQDEEDTAAARKRKAKDAKRLAKAMKEKQDASDFVGQLKAMVGLGPVRCPPAVLWLTRR